MTRYVSRKPRAAFIGDELTEYDFPERQSLTVHDDEIETWTGLLDASGNELHRMQDPIGFRFQEHAA